MTGAGTLLLRLLTSADRARWRSASSPGVCPKLWLVCGGEGRNVSGSSSMLLALVSRLCGGRGEVEEEDEEECGDECDTDRLVAWAAPTTGAECLRRCSLIPVGVLVCDRPGVPLFVSPPLCWNSAMTSAGMRCCSAHCAQNPLSCRLDTSR